MTSTSAPACPDCGGIRTADHTCNPPRPNGATRHV